MTKKMGIDIKGKLEDRGEMCTFLGYARNHSGDTYRMKNDKTGEVLITRDIKWTKNENEACTPSKNLEVKDEDENRQEIIEEPEHEIVFEPDTENDRNEPLFNNEQLEVEASTLTVRRISREVRGLQSYNKPGRLEIEEEVHFCFNVEEIIEETEPKMFQEAWWHPDEGKRKKWRESIRLEFRQMLRNGVWRKHDGCVTIPRG